MVTKENWILFVAKRVYNLNISNKAASISLRVMIKNMAAGSIKEPVPRPLINM
jgi:hypothetical protein